MQYLGITVVHMGKIVIGSKCREKILPLVLSTENMKQVLSAGRTCNGPKHRKTCNWYRPQEKFATTTKRGKKLSTTTVVACTTKCKKNMTLIPSAHKTCNYYQAQGKLYK